MPEARPLCTAVRPLRMAAASAICLPLVRNPKGHGTSTPGTAFSTQHPACAFLSPLLRILPVLLVVGKRISPVAPSEQGVGSEGDWAPLRRPGKLGITLSRAHRVLCCSEGSDDEQKPLWVQRQSCNRYPRCVVAPRAARGRTDLAVVATKEPNRAALVGKGRGRRRGEGRVGGRIHTVITTKY